MWFILPLITEKFRSNAKAIGLYSKDVGSHLDRDTAILTAFSWFFSVHYLRDEIWDLKHL
jgi:hypothetical protein